MGGKKACIWTSKKKKLKKLKPYERASSVMRRKKLEGRAKLAPRGERYLTHYLKDICHYL